MTSVRVRLSTAVESHRLGSPYGPAASPYNYKKARKKKKKKHKVIKQHIMRERKGWKDEWKVEKNHREAVDSTNSTVMMLGNLLEIEQA